MTGILFHWRFRSASSCCFHPKLRILSHLQLTLYFCQLWERIRVSHSDSIRLPSSTHNRNQASFFGVKAIRATGSIWDGSMTFLNSFLSIFVLAKFSCVLASTVQGTIHWSSFIGQWFDTTVGHAEFSRMAISHLSNSDRGPQKLSFHRSKASAILILYLQSVLVVNCLRSLPLHVVSSGYLNFLPP